MTREHRSGNGFTLVELVVVLCVIAALIAVMVPLLATRYEAMRDTALVDAAQNGDWYRVTTLLKRGANPDGYSGASPHYCLMCQAIAMNRVDMAELILQSERSKKSHYLNHGLSHAVQADNVPIAELLLKHGADPNSQNPWTTVVMGRDGEKRWQFWGRNLHLAAKSGNRELVDLLLAHGAQARVGLEFDILPEDVARSFGHDELAAYLDEVGKRELREVEDTAPQRDGEASNDATETALTRVITEDEAVR
jgi:prepilin-type N-terminal cleavage/methylation domain-containing protein